jgi:hypothetical protein
MENVYDSCPQFENEKYLMRFVQKPDADDLLKIYSDKNALPFFNSDNCDGDIFYYDTIEKILKAIDFWIYSYDNKWFVRWVIIDKETSTVIGTIELFQRLSDDDFNENGVLRLDLRSDHERAEIIENILSLIIPSAYDLFGCNEIASKVPNYAVEREKAFSSYGFTRTDSGLVSKDGSVFYGYMRIRQK